jgi:uncharacterized oxidoreductase
MVTPLPIKQIIPLITGGGSGIGLGLVKEFVRRGSPKVLITGRREAVLQDVVNQYPTGTIHYKVSDAGNVADRVALFEWIKREHNDCNALINNAGVQRRVPMVQDTDTKWEDRISEIEINLNGPIHLCTLFTPYLLEKDIAVLSNVSSGLAFIPFTAGPVYAATKAAIHSYTMSLRFSLQDTNLRVIEIIPPAVKTSLGGAHDFGEDLTEYVTATMDRIEAGELEVGYKFSESARLADRSTLDGMMNNLSAMMQVPKFAPSSSASSKEN